MKRQYIVLMFDCAGLYDDLIVTISHPCGEIAFRNKDTLEKKLDINIPLKLGGCAYIEEHKLFLTSRNICGIAFVDLDNLGGK